MAKLTPEQAQEKHARNLKASTPDIKAGVLRVTVPPGQLAAAQVDKMRTNINKSLDDGTWARMVAKTTLPEWQEKMVNKGIPRIAAGIDGAKEKTTEFYSQLFPFQDRILSELNNMPSVDLEDGINRAVFNMREMAKFKRE